MIRFLFLFTFFISTYIQPDINNALVETYKTSSKNDLIKIVIKDNIDIEGKVTSAGSLALSGNIAKKMHLSLRSLLMQTMTFMEKQIFLNGQILDRQILLVVGPV